MAGPEMGKGSAISPHRGFTLGQPGQDGAAGGIGEGGVGGVEVLHNR